jgi:transcriptional regulator with XRE-family HTH domain
MPDYMSIFSRRLQELRLQKGLSQQQLGGFFNAPKQTVHSWEKGQAAPTMLKLCELADILEVSLDYLVGRSDNPVPR